MFLDDELLAMCKNTDLITPKSVQQLYNDICVKCKERYMSEITTSTTYSQVKTALDKVFNLWDSFIKMAKNDEDSVINMIGNLFEKHSFREQLLNNKEIKEIYDKGFNFK